jgi:putative DNA primase/helicase
MANAPEMECAKTLLIKHVVGQMVPRMLYVELMKPAPFFRMAQRFKPTFVIDEVDLFIKEDSDLLAALNTGYEPNGYVPRCTGDNYDVQLYTTHCPVAIGGIDLLRKLPASTISRCIVINLERATYEELIQLSPTAPEDPELVEIGRKLMRWTRDNRLKIANPVYSELTGRVANKWAPLLQIASVASPKLYERCLEAIYQEKKGQEVVLSRSQELLVDIWRALGDKDKLFTEDLITAIASDSNSQWTEYNYRDRKDRRIKPTQVARLLKPYGVKPKKIRIGAKTAKGYVKNELQTPYRRYIEPSLEGTREHPNRQVDFYEDLRGTMKTGVHSDKSSKLTSHVGCSLVHATAEATCIDQSVRADRCVVNKFDFNTAVPELQKAIESRSAIGESGSELSKLEFGAEDSKLAHVRCLDCAYDQPHGDVCAAKMMRTDRFNRVRLCGIFKEKDRVNIDTYGSDHPTTI